MRLRLIFWAGLLSLVSGLLVWRNQRHYPVKSMSWWILKSTSEIAVLILSGLRLPIVLISWSCLWLTRPIRTTWIKATVGAIAGIIFGFLALYALELLIIVGVFSIDDITGEREGFLKNFRRAKQAAARA